MTNEEMQKMVEFILEQQSTITVTLDRVGEKVNQLAEAQQRTEKSLAELAAAQTQQARQQAHMNEVVATIADAQQRIESLSLQKRRPARIRSWLRLTSA